MSNDIRTALNIIQDETTVINAFVIFKEKRPRSNMIQVMIDEYLERNKK